MFITQNLFPYSTFIFLLLCGFQTTAQNSNYQNLNNSLKTDSIVFDAYNTDGLFKARHHKTKKWGLYQTIGGEISEIIPMQYDSLGFFDHRTGYTLVKNNGKYGVISEYDNNVTLASEYDKLAILKTKSGERAMLAAKVKDKWGYIDEKTGDTLMPFAFKTKKDLPPPDPIYYKNPNKKFSEEYYSIFNRPDTITRLNLSFQKLNFLPNEIKNCTQLKYLNLEGNFFNKVPEVLKELPNLEVLYLGANHRIVELNRNKSLHILTDLKNLKALSLGNVVTNSNNLSKSFYSSYIYIPRDFKFPPNLETLKIGSSDSEVFDLVYAYPGLKKLSIIGNFRSPISVDFNKIASKNSLESLTLSYTESAKSLNTHIAQYPNLSYLGVVFIYPDSSNIENIKTLKHLEDLFIGVYYEGETTEEGVLVHRKTFADFSMLKYKKGNLKVSQTELAKAAQDFENFVLKK